MIDESANGQRAMLALLLVTTAAIAGVAVVWSGNMFGERAAYFIAMFGSIGAATLIAATRKEPLRFIFLASIVALPVSNALVPPGRLGLNMFNVITLVLTIGVLARYAFSQPANRQPLFPTRSLSIAWTLILPCVVLSQFPVVSTLSLILLFAGYAFFLLCLAELQRERGFERLVVLFSATSIILAIGVLIDYVWRANLSLRGTNLNRLTYTDDAVEIYRASGFFQDPQHGGAFFAVLITFLLVVAVRGRLVTPGVRAVVWVAIAAGFAALFMTISRSAIISCLVVSLVALFAFNAWTWHLKAAIASVFVVVVTFLSQTSFDTWLGLLPETVQTRIREIPEAFEDRLDIWLDTWDMFSNHPTAGIGLGSFRSYLLQTRPGVTNYYGIGTGAGVDYIPDQPESGFLKILYEGGVFGSAAALFLLVDAIRRALKGAFGASPEGRTECIAALAALLTLGVTFTTLFNIDDPRIVGLLAFLLAVIWSRSLPLARSARQA